MLTSRGSGTGASQRVHRRRRGDRLVEGARRPARRVGDVRRNGGLGTLEQARERVPGVTLLRFTYSGRRTPGPTTPWVTWTRA